MATNGSDNTWEQSLGFATRAIHSGQEPEQWSSCCLIPPIVTSATFKQESPDKNKGFSYSRSGNPTRQVLERNLASLDGGKYGLVCSSGLGAAHCVASLLGQGDRVICGNDLYGGSKNLFSKLMSKLGIEVIFIDMKNPANLDSVLNDKTKMVWCETPTNSLLEVVDLREVVARVKKYPKAIMVVDNTFLTPYFQRPLEFGADIVLYSLTKYMNGHNDVLMGAIVTSNDDLYERLKFLQKAQGFASSPFECYLTIRGLKTLQIRMDRHMSSGLEVARWLERHPGVERVSHPGLPSHPQHEVFARQTSGCSGMMSVYLRGNLETAKTFLKALRVITLAGSLGGCESLATLPYIMSPHADSPHEERVRLGITENLVRLSIGLEDTKDLIDDLEQALRRAST